MPAATHGWAACASNARPAVGVAGQPSHGMADRLEHALDLMLATLVQRELDEPRHKQARLGRSRAAVSELDALAERCERLRVGRALDLGLVHLPDAVARVR